MGKMVQVLQVPVALLDRAEREERLPPGAGLLIAFGFSFLCYAALIATFA